ncbi:predicted protein [Nematostella vectensis]|uniref:JNK1/MAPK8-associated membrane protein n=1 Tax=Nematostella vectensis TaxID=45351 RepID=A7RVN2_NEMVE|nr:predicted protein [Nematostella vectensis]|eukprot:XP_001636478.1 predicted protein [Nematostella vectensis]
MFSTLFYLSVELEKCPGQYCGRVQDRNGKFGKCQACPRGYRSYGDLCVKCTKSLRLHDWLYLGFIILTVIVLHWFFIDYFVQRVRQNMILLFVSSVIETTLAAIFTLLVNEPKGTLNLTACWTERLSDWYTVFFNPKPDYVNTIHCTNEAVYPLYTIVLTFHAIAVTMLILIRPVLSHRMCAGSGLSSIYAAMYFLPVLAAVHALLGGLLYYSYPYITLVVSVISTAVVLSKNKITNIRQLMGSKRHISIVFGHWLINAYGLLAVTEVTQPSVHGPMFLLVTTPVLFYLATSSLTEPNKFKQLLAG